MILRYQLMEERIVVRHAYVIAALWPLLGTEIRNRQSSENSEIR